MEEITNPEKRVTYGTPDIVKEVYKRTGGLIEINTDTINYHLKALSKQEKLHMKQKEKEHNKRYVNDKTSYKFEKPMFQRENGAHWSLTEKEFEIAVMMIIIKEEKKGQSNKANFPISSDFLSI